MTEVKINRLKALDLDGRRDPKFKESCRRMWSPQFFKWCEDKIAEIKRVEAVEDKHFYRQDLGMLDISEINVEGG